MARRHGFGLVLALAVGVGVGSISCTNEPVPERPALTGSVPAAGTTRVLPTLAPDTIPTTTRPPATTAR
jgi:hypothetical protein